MDEIIFWASLTGSLTPFRLTLSRVSTSLGPSAPAPHATIEPAQPRILRSTLGWAIPGDTPAKR
jgi:hypothetical protein